MLKVLRTRFQQKYRTMPYPNGAPPQLPDRFAGMPLFGAACDKNCHLCANICPTNAILCKESPTLDIGKCLFCRKCEQICPTGSLKFGSEYRLAAAERTALIIEHIDGTLSKIAPAKNELAAKLFKRSLKLRQVSAGGCNACEADCNVLGTPAWDMGRFGIQFVASPRHADGLLITGPVTENMRVALEKTYAAVPSPKIVIAVGACAISGGIFSGHAEQHNGATSILPIDLFIPGCPPHPLTIFDGLLRFLGYVND